MALVDRIGRKPLLYAGVGGMTASLFTLAVAFHFQAALAGSLGILATVCLMVYITCFAASMGPIAWILVAEVFPLRLRGRGSVGCHDSGRRHPQNFYCFMTFLSLLNAARELAPR